MNNYFNQNRTGYPAYPSNPPFGSYGEDYNQNRAPYPIGFENMPNPDSTPSFSHQSTSSFPPSQPPYWQPSSTGAGFPIAPSNSQQSYPPFQTNNSKPISNYPIQPSYVPTPPNYKPTPSNYLSTQPSYVPTPPSYVPTPPSYLPTLNQNNQNFYPSLGQVNPMNQSQVRVSNPTVRPHQPFIPGDDAAKLYKAMKGFGTDESALIEILCKRASAQRLEIAIVFKASYGKDLIKNIESETSGDFRDLLVALLTKPMVIEASYLRESVKGLGTDEASLIDAVCTKTNAEMIDLKNTYHQMYRRSLEEDVKDDVSGYFKRFLVSLMAAHRLETPPDQQKAVQLAKELYEAGERRIGTNEVVFNRIFSYESFAQLRMVFEEYQKISGHPIEKAIKSEMSSSIERAFLTVVDIVKNPAAYFAQRLYESMKGIGTKDKLLIKLMVLRSEIDMMDIKNEFQLKYKKTLESFIKSDCSGDYKRALLCLAGDPKWR